MGTLYPAFKDHDPKYRKNNIHVLDQAYDSHLRTALRTNQVIDFLDLFDKLPLNVFRGCSRDLCLVDFGELLRCVDSKGVSKILSGYTY